MVLCTLCIHCTSTQIRMYASMAQEMGTCLCVCACMRTRACVCAFFLNILSANRKQQIMLILMSPENIELMHLCHT